jgi:hypothetical protein
MRTLTLAAALAMVACLSTTAQTADAQSEIFKVGEEASNLYSMNVMALRKQRCGGEWTEGNQDAKNAKYIGCVMYVLGVVDMLREWQKIDPAHALPVCVPRN